MSEEDFEGDVDEFDFPDDDSGSDSAEVFGDEPSEPTTEEDIAFCISPEGWVYAGEEFHWAIEEALDSLDMSLTGFPTWIYCIPLGTGTLRGSVTNEGRFIEWLDNEWSDKEGKVCSKSSLQLTAILER